MSWWDVTWVYRKTITLATSTYLSNDVTTNHTILIKQDASDTDFWSHVDTNGEDVRFIAADDSTELKFHFEKFDHTNDLMVAWVKVEDTFSASGNMDIYMYYGKSSQTSTADEANTYTTDHHAVWHLKETTGSTAYDSTSNSYDGTIGSAITLNRTGVADKCMLGATNNSNSKVVVLGDNNLNDTGSITVSLWFKTVNATYSDFEVLIVKGLDWGDAGAWAINFGVSDNGYVRFYLRGLTGNEQAEAQQDYYDQAWHHVVGIYDKENGRIKIFMDGVSRDDVVCSGNRASNTDDLWLFSRSLYSWAYSGAYDIDEAKVWGIALTDDAAKLLFRSENEDLQSYGSEEQAAQTGYYDCSASLNVEKKAYADRNASLNIEKKAYADRSALLDVNYEVVIVSPKNGVQETSPVYLVFTSTNESFSGKKHFVIELDKTSSAFGDLEINPKSYLNQNNWQYWDGAAWQSLPANGLPSDKFGNDVRYQATLATGNKWWRAKEVET